MQQPKLAIVTGASSGIGLEIAKLAAADGYDLIVAADMPLIDAAAALQGLGADVVSVEADLATEEGVRRLLDAAEGRKIDVLVANAGQGHGGAFLDQAPDSWRHVIDTNITGTLLLIQPVAAAMAARNEGRILITGSIAGYVAGAFNAVYNGTKAFIDLFADALGNELKETNVTVTCLKPGATDTPFFERAEMLDTKVGQAEKDDPADVARTGWDAMNAGKRSIVHGWKNQLQVAAVKVAGGGVAAELHRQQAEPGSAARD